MKKFIKYVFAMMICCMWMLPATTAFAGNISAEEQRLIDAANHHYYYGGKEYEPTADGLERAKNYLLQDDVDLDHDQVNKAIARLDGSVEDGIAQGFLQEVKKSGGNKGGNSGSTGGNGGAAAEAPAQTITPAGAPTTPSPSTTKPIVIAGDPNAQKNQTTAEDVAEETEVEEEIDDAEEEEPEEVLTEEEPEEEITETSDADIDGFLKEVLTEEEETPAKKSGFSFSLIVILAILAVVIALILAIVALTGKNNKKK